MPSLITGTRKALAELASSDEFEALATAVLRAADQRYAALIHVGTNDAGRAIVSPVDGIGIREHRGSRQLLLVQHTITARKGLRRKWLDGKDGDVTKARAIAEKERERDASRHATLVICCSSDPDQELIRDVHAAAGPNLSIDLWPGSRIADFLDRNPEGQWLRQQVFETQATRLSAPQARVIAAQSLDDYVPLAPREEMVSRKLDQALSDFARQGREVGFIIGESGLGKSAALRRLGEEWCTEGGIALVLPHEFVEKASSIEQAIALGLQHWAPALNRECGASALALATPEHPILLIVEDINLSANPRRIIERLIGWSSGRQRDNAAGAVSQVWRLLCPVWRANAGISDSQLKDRVLARALAVDRFEPGEAIAAIHQRAAKIGVALTPLQAADLARALGDDPLLIGLNRDWSAPDPKDAIQSYIRGNIEEAADDRLLASDLRDALDQLAEKFVAARKISPNWGQIRQWYAGDGDTLAAIRRLVDQGRIIRLGTTADSDRLVYRHDRVRDHLLSQAMTRLAAQGTLEETLWADPFYADLLGAALKSLGVTAIDTARRLNPAALFAALQDTNLSADRRDAIIGAAHAWIDSPDFKGEASEQRQHHAMRYLARTDGEFVLKLAKRFPFSFPKYEALFRNGDAGAGAAYCSASDPGVNDSWRDRLVAHALSRHPNIVVALGELILCDDLSAKQLEGALNLAGEIGDTSLCEALAARWAQVGSRKTLSTGWLWASLRCCPSIEHPLADAICDVWALLPRTVKRAGNKIDRHPRWDIAMHELAFGLRRKASVETVRFLIARAERDRRLKRLIISMLAKIDQPEAVLYVSRAAGRYTRRAEAKGYHNFFSSDLERNWSPDQHGWTMSVESRAALAQIWRNRRRNRYDRRSAFLVWRQTPTRQEVSELAALEADPVLADAALRTRLDAGDRSAIPLLKQRLWRDKKGQYWWYQARKVGLDDLHDDVLRWMEERRTSADADSHSYNIVAELLMEANDDFARSVVIQHWDHLQTDDTFVHAALYFAVPETVELARSALAKGEDPQRMLAHIDSHWGIRTTGRRGVTTLSQLQVLEPYYALMQKAEHGDLNISSFFGEANRLGALEWRKNHLDPLAALGNRMDCPGEESALHKSLDAEVKIYLQYDRSWFAIDHWFERREEELWQRAELLRVIGRWAKERGSDPATALLSEALLYFGERHDLALLEGLTATQRERNANEIANCIYDVRRRSLSA
jgi:hypothetical protein